jgi:endonuclease YncB( thermonuclease family)
MLPWIGALAVLGGGILLYDNIKLVRQTVAGIGSVQLPRFAESVPDAPNRTPSTKSTAVVAAPQRPVTPVPAPRQPDHNLTAAIVPPAPVGKPEPQPPAAIAAVARPGDSLAGSYEGKFFLCGTAKQDDCVLSADRFVFHGQKIRLVGIEVPDIKKPRCEAERIKASDAELRVRAFLDSGPFELVSWQGNGDEIDGHKLRVVSRNGRSLSDILVNEGLAKRPGRGKGGWC